MELAKENANNSNYINQNFGCVAVYKGKVIAKGYNLYKTHPEQMVYNEEYRNPNKEFWGTHSLHAEMLCINRIVNSHMDKSKFRKIKLYIYRKRKDKPYGMSRPCPACMNRLKDLGFKEIYYTTDDGIAHEFIES